MNRQHVAIVTGAAGRLGYAICQRLGAQGHRLALIDVSPAVHDAAEKLQAQGLQARAVQIDITAPEQVQTLPAQLDDWWADVAILINNAGISPKTNGQKSTVMDMPLAEWSRVLAVNLTGMFLVTQQCLAPMRDNAWGRIVMIASQAARTRTVVPGAHYQATKAGMVAFARVLAAEVAGFGITVNSVAPGRIETDMTAAVSTATNTSLANQIPAGRMGRADEVAGAVAYFTSAEASYSTGAIIDVNGGSFMP